MLGRQKSYALQITTHIPQIRVIVSCDICVSKGFDCSKKIGYLLRINPLPIISVVGQLEHKTKTLFFRHQFHLWIIEYKVDGKIKNNLTWALKNLEPVLSWHVYSAAIECRAIKTDRNVVGRLFRVNSNNIFICVRVLIHKNLDPYDGNMSRQGHAGRNA